MTSTQTIDPDTVARVSRMGDAARKKALQQARNAEVHAARALEAVDGHAKAPRPGSASLTVSPSGRPPVEISIGPALSVELITFIRPRLVREHRAARKKLADLEAAVAEAARLAARDADAARDATTGAEQETGIGPGDQPDGGGDDVSS